MKIIQKTGGPKIAHTIRGNKITFGDDELTLNLERWERDEDNHIDLCRDKFGNLIMGVIAGRAEAYLAQIFIPARRFEYKEAPGARGPEGMTAFAAAGADMAAGAADVTDSDEGSEDFAEISEIRTALPFDIKAATLTLWGEMPDDNGGAV